MNYKTLLIFLFFFAVQSSYAESRRSISTLADTFSKLDLVLSSSKEEWESACKNISQFVLKGSAIELSPRLMADDYDSGALVEYKSICPEDDYRLRDIGMWNRPHKATSDFRFMRYLKH